jgi:hypothetical protein
MSDALRLAAETIRENPERWTKGTYYRDSNGWALYHPDNACSACAIGMTFIAADVIDAKIHEDDLHMLSLNVSCRGVAGINDTAYHAADVAKYLDELADAA